MRLSQIGKPVILEMDFLDPYTDEPTGIKVKLHSLKSKIGKEALHAVQIQVLEYKEKEQEIDNDKLNKDLLSALFESVTGLEDEDGKPIKSSKKAFIQAIQESREFYISCLSFISNSGNFSKVSEKNL